MQRRLGPRKCPGHCPYYWARGTNSKQPDERSLAGHEPVGSACLSVSLLCIAVSVSRFAELTGRSLPRLALQDSNGGQTLLRSSGDCVSPFSFSAGTLRSTLPSSPAEFRSNQQNSSRTALSHDTLL